MFLEEYDVIVVGAGHAGCEAAAASANLGCSTLLVTMSLQNIAQMSCNPAMGGIAKGQIVREIDALGGYSGIISDKTAIQFKMLNKSKGPAMWSPRVQSDRMRFSEEWRLMLEETPNLDFYQEMVSGIHIENNKVLGIKTSLGLTIRGKSVVLTNGTFLNGLIHIGDKQFGGGRAGESAAYGITEDLIKVGFESGRMKTGTPPRVDGRSLDYSKMNVESGDIRPDKFSYSDVTKPLSHQRDCHMTYTSPLVHDLLREGFDRSPMFNGRIKSLGPRYCPSIEDKINRFADKDRHQLFIEPEGWKTCEVYVNGFSTSLPEDIQFKALRSVAGFEKVKFFRPGYAIEYDYFPPTQLKHTLETKLVDEREFLFYKLANDEDICPKLKSWERQEGKFLIKYKIHTPINIFTNNKKELVINLVIKLHKMGIFHGNINKDNIVYNEYEGVKLTNFSEALWIDEIDEKFLLNNSYGKPCSNIEELLGLELNKINEIFDFLNNDGTVKEKNSNDDHLHSSDEENVYY